MATELEIIDTDILILGGGLAGCMAAIRAKERNIDVAIVEKAAIKRSGEAGRGLDHYPAIAHPKINGLVAEEYGRIRANDLAGLASRKLSIITAKDALKPVVVLEDIGVKVREEDGTFKMIAGRIGGGFTRREGEEKIGTAGDFILYRGADLKIRLAAEVRRRGVRLFEHTMLTSLITKDGSVVGATAVNVRNGEFLVFRAKAILLATGNAQSRMYDYRFSAFPNNLFTGYSNPANSGNGHIAAYRAGAELTNLEFVSIAVNSLGWSPSPQGAVFCGKMKNLKGEELFAKYPGVREQEKGGGFSPWVKYLFMPSMSDPEIERNVIMYYWDGVPESAEWYGAFMSASETPIVLKMTQDRGGLRNAPYELSAWLRGIIRSFGGVLHDEKGETSLKGLFVAGDVGGGMPAYGSTGALVWGYRIGDYLAECIPDTKKPVLDAEQLRQVQKEKERVLAPLRRTDGVNPLELEDLTRKVMSHYVGIKKIEPRLKRGLQQIRILKEKFVPKLVATNPHELMRALEVQDIIDLSELHAQTALLRTETRMPPYHYRVDYPEQDDANWRKNIVVKSAVGQMKYTLETLD